MGGGSNRNSETRSEQTADRNDERAARFADADTTVDNEEADDGEETELPSFEDFSYNPDDETTGPDGSDDPENEEEDKEEETAAPLGEQGGPIDTAEAGPTTDEEAPTEDEDTDVPAEDAAVEAGNGVASTVAAVESTPTTDPGDSMPPELDVRPPEDRPTNPRSGEPLDEEAQAVYEEIEQIVAARPPPDDSINEQQRWFGETVGEPLVEMLADGFSPGAVAAASETAVTTDLVPIQDVGGSTRTAAEALFRSIPGVRRPETQNELRYGMTDGQAFGDELLERFSENFAEEYPALAERLEDRDLVADGPAAAVEQTISKAHGQQLGAMYGRDIAPYFFAAQEMTGNDNIPHEQMGRETTFGTPENPYQFDVDEAEMTVVREKIGQTQAVLKDTFGETVTLYRGMKGSNRRGGQPAGNSTIGDELREAAVEGESVTVDHRPLETWTLNPQVAGGYSGGGATLRREVPVDQIVASGMTGGKLPSTEVVVAHEPTSSYNSEQLITPERHDTPRLSGADPIWHETIEQAHQLIRTAEANGEPLAGRDGTQAVSPVTTTGGRTPAARDRAEHTASTPTASRRIRDPYRTEEGSGDSDESA